MEREKVFLSTIDDNAHLLAKRYGLKLELAEYCTAWNMDREFEQTDRLVKEKLGFAQAAVLHGPYSELFPCAIDPEVRKVAANRYGQALRLARSYGIHRVVIHGGFNPWLYFPCWYVEQSQIFWQEFVREIPEGMTILLENVLEKQPEDMAQIIRHVNDPRLRMCLDVGHAHAYADADEFQWLRECADIIDHFHIHNNDKSRDTHSPLAEGTIPMENLLKEITNTCPHATMTLELMDAASSLQWLTDKGLLEE